MKKFIQILKILAWCISIAGIGTLLGFANGRQEAVRCSKINIRIDQAQGNYFLEKKDILKILKNDGSGTLINQLLKSIDLSSLEYNIEQNRYLQNAEVYIDINGELTIEAEQRTPALRIINYKNEGYYIDNKGYKMPLSAEYTAQVQVANGYIAEACGSKKDSIRTPILKALTNVNNFIQKDPWLQALFVQIYVNETQTICLVPRIGNQLIIIGDDKDLESKFERLKIFYKKAMPLVGWNKYKTINLTYKNQIVASK